MTDDVTWRVFHIRRHHLEEIFQFNYILSHSPVSHCFFYLFSSSVFESHSLSAGAQQKWKRSHQLDLYEPKPPQPGADGPGCEGPGLEDDLATPAVLPQVCVWNRFCFLLCVFWKVYKPINDFFIYIALYNLPRCFTKRGKIICRILGLDNHFSISPSGVIVLWLISKTLNVFQNQCARIRDF